MGRSELAVPIISTQLVTDTLVGERESLENLHRRDVRVRDALGGRGGARAGAARAGRRGPAHAQSLLELDAGRCLFRDHRGRVEAIQVDVVVPDCCGPSRRPPRPGDRRPGGAAREARCARRRRWLWLGEPPPSACRRGALAARRATARAPSSPSPEHGPAAGDRRGVGAARKAAEGAPQGEADPLVSNGLGSPLCKGLLGAGNCPAAPVRDCETSGFVAAPAPTGNYGIDVHIDTGVLGLSYGGL